MALPSSETWSGHNNDSWGLSLLQRIWFTPLIDPKFNCTKEGFYPGLPEVFQRAGITVLLYDPRTYNSTMDLRPFEEAWL